MELGSSTQKETNNICIKENDRMVTCPINCFWFDETDSLSEILSAENSGWAEYIKYFEIAKGKKKPQMSLWLKPLYILSWIWWVVALVTQIYLDLPPLVWDMIAFTWNQQMAPQCISIWGVALEAGDFKLIIEWN